MSIRRHWDLLLVAAATLLGACLRFTHLAQPDFWIDEAFSVVHARAILSHGFPLLPSGEVSWNYFPVHYLMAAGLALFPAQHLGARVFSALAGTAMVPAVYFLTRRVTGTRLGAVVAAFVLAALSYQVGWSRQARMYVFLQLFCVLAIHAFWRFQETARPADLVRAAAFTSLSLFTHRAGFLLVPALGVSALARPPGTYTWPGWWRKHPVCAALCLACIAAAALVLPGATSASSAGAALRHVTRQGGQTYSPYYVRFLYLSSGGLLGWAAVGAAWAVWRSPRRAGPVVLAMLVYFFAVANRTILYHMRYMLPLVPFLAMFAGAGAGILVDEARRSSARVLRAAPVVCLALFAAACAGSHMSWVPVQDYDLGATAPRPPWRNAYAWIRAHHARFLSDEPSIQTISTFPVFHDLYLGTKAGRKYFLPFSLTGYQGEYRERSRYTDAAVLSGFSELKRTDGYLVLDDLGLSRLKDVVTWEYLMENPPDRVEHGTGPYRVYIWKWFW